ncbi:calcium-binding and coiled-coil domain-containing protein 2 [Clupea harengus]|uniref:Calcium-binding and coiled-coil domain-containing protein 2 n=1 Tax=Clupea harengus TaxID=7950 RepID=A0A8M1KJ46_CLUHA|nr:calcium-binding and coiled-coil domain-containing protein 2 [Clupea harengus]XP_042561822.1 calcium-binding and coiled-coil domain-containing protein 2 [Clupea harengus]XP_042561823.1 calcium-binding and coiled-coil domain-containing protein 2 [Clupea harengus]XP_042561824.1 calcium-binding and coiled-coil domain-containing protein 2 [Clupea harengus]
MNESQEAETLSTEMDSTTTYSQVVFIDVPRSYPPNTNVNCGYTLTGGLQPHPKDWIGVYKVGWNTTQNYYTFVWVEPCLDRLGPDPVTRQVVFNDYYLPKDDGDYQFCYVDHMGQVRGASTPFCFENLQDTLYTSLENDILVVSTQEQTEQMEKEKEELRQEVEQLKEGEQILKNELDGRLEEIHRLRLTIEEMKNSVSTDAQPPGCESTDVLMEQLSPEVVAVPNLKQPEESLAQSQAPLDEKYDKALQKIKQLKQQRKELMATTENQQAEISRLNLKVKEMEQDLSRLRDDVQLFQVDLQSSQNEKLCADVQQLEELKRDLEGIKKEKERLQASLLTLTPQREDESTVKLQREALLSQLQETRIKLRQELQGANEAGKRAEAAERELRELRCQLEQRATTQSINEPQCKDISLEIKLKEALRTIDDQTVIIDLAREEQEDFDKKNQDLQNEVDVLREELARVKPGTPAAPDSTPFSYPSFSSFQDPSTNSLQGSLLYGNPYDNAEGANEDKVPQCQHCLISFPGISQEELTQHEESHKVCPICTFICDEMEQPEFEDHVYTHDI